MTLVKIMITRIALVTLMTLINLIALMTLMTTMKVIYYLVIKVRDALPDQIVCFFEHCSNGL